MKVLVATALYPTRENPAYGAFVQTQVESLRRAGVDLDLLVLRGRPRKTIYPKGIIQLHQRLATAPISLVHAHYGYVGMVARAQWNVPVVVTYHGDDLLGTIGPNGKTRYVSRWVAAAGRLLARTVDAVIVQSEQMASKLDHPNLHIIPHEVDLQTFQPIDQTLAKAALGLDPSKKYLLFAANPSIPVKRFPLANAVAQRLALHDAGIQLLVVYREPQERLALYMNACDVLLFPSYQEGSPNIVKQAMACNLPIVATDVGDVRKVIGTTDGCAISDADIEPFAAAVWKLLERGERTDGRKQVMHLDSANVARQIMDVYDSCFRRRRR